MRTIAITREALDEGSGVLTEALRRLGGAARVIPCPGPKWHDYTITHAKGVPMTEHCALHLTEEPQ